MERYLEFATAESFAAFRFSPWRPSSWENMLSGQLFIAVTMFLFTVRWQGPRSFDTTQAWKQTSGDPSGRTVHYCGVTLLYIQMKFSELLRT